MKSAFHGVFAAAILAATLAAPSASAEYPFYPPAKNGETGDIFSPHKDRPCINLDENEAEIFISGRASRGQNSLLLRRRTEQVWMLGYAAENNKNTWTAAAAYDSDKGEGAFSAQWKINF